MSKIGINLDLSSAIDDVNKLAESFEKAGKKVHKLVDITNDLKRNFSGVGKNAAPALNKTDFNSIKDMLNASKTGVIASKSNAVHDIDKLIGTLSTLSGIQGKFSGIKSRNLRSTDKNLSDLKKIRKNLTGKEYVTTVSDDKLIGQQQRELESLKTGSPRHFKKIDKEMNALLGKINAGVYEYIKELESSINSAIPGSTAPKDKPKSKKVKLNNTSFYQEDINDPVMGPLIKNSMKNDKKRAQGYADVAASAKARTALMEREAPLKMAKMAMSTLKSSNDISQAKSDSSNFIANYFRELGSSAAHGYIPGAGRLGLSALTDTTASIAKNHFLKKEAFQTPEFWGTDTALDAFEGKIKTTKAFEILKEKMNEALEDGVAKFTPDDIFKKLKAGEISRAEFTQKLSKEDIKALNKDLEKSDKKDLVKKLKKSPQDMAVTLGGMAKNPATGLSKIAGIAAVPSTVLAVADSIGKLGAACINAYEGVEQLKVQMGVVFGSRTESESMFAQIEEYAKTSPFGVENMTQQAVLLKQSGVYASELMDTMKRIGDISSGNNEKMRSLSEVYARVMSSTTVTARDMRQLSNAGVASYEALSKATGIDRSQLRSKLQSGQIKSSDFKKMLKELTDEGGTFYGATERGAKTVAARKQNLSDKRQMAMSGIGELLVRMGSRDGVKNSYYDSLLELVGNIWGGVERVAENTKDKKNIKDADFQQKEYFKLLEELAEAEEKGNKKKVKKLQAEINEYAASYEEAQQMKFASQANLYEREKEKQEDKSDSTKEVEAEYRRQIIEQATAILNRIDAARAEGFTGSNEDYIQDADERAVLHYYEDLQKKDALLNENESGWVQTKLVDSITKGFDTLDAALNDPYGGQTRINAAKKDWEDNSSIAQMMAKDKKAAEDAELKRKYDYYDSKAMTVDAKTGEQKYNLGKLTATEMKDALENIFVGGEKLKLGREQVIGIDNNITEEGVKALEEYKNNLQQVYDAAINSGEEANEEYLLKMEELLALLSEDFTEFDAEKLNEKVSEFSKLMGVELPEAIQKAMDAVINAEGEDSDRAKVLAAILQNTQTAATHQEYNTENKKYLNKRKNPTLLSNILSNLTGVDANRVELTGSKKIMSSYTENFAQRNMMSSIGKALLANGSSIKDLADVMSANYKGRDGYGHGTFDYRNAASTMEMMAAQRNVETQDALIAAYQEQIDSLNELALSGIATRDQWDNVNSLAQHMGSAFSFAAEEMADGTYKFTEAALEAANNFKKELNVKLLIQKIDNVLNRKLKEVRGNTTGNLVDIYSVGKKNYQLSDMSTDYALQFSPLLKEAIDTVITSDKETIALALENKTLKNLFSEKKSNLSQTSMRKLGVSTGIELPSYVSLEGRTTDPKFLQERETAMLKYFAGSKLGALGLDSGNKKLQDLQISLQTALASKNSSAEIDKWLKQALHDNLLTTIFNAVSSRGFGWDKYNYDDNTGHLSWVDRGAGKDQVVAQGYYMENGIRMPFNTSTTYFADAQGNIRAVADNENDQTETLTKNFEELAERWKNGTVSSDDISTLVSVLSEIDTGFKDRINDLKKALDDNTKSNYIRAAKVETGYSIDQIADFNKMYGFVGQSQKELMGSRDFASMEDYAPSKLLSYNGMAMDSMLDWLGYDPNLSYSEVMKRISTQASATLVSVEDTYQDTLKEIEELYEEELRAAGIDLSEPLTDEQKKQRNEIQANREENIKAADKQKQEDMLTQQNTLEQLGGFMTSYGRDKVISMLVKGETAEGISSKDYLEALGELDDDANGRDVRKALGNHIDDIVGEDGLIDTEKVTELLALMEELGISSEDIAEAWAKTGVAMGSSARLMTELKGNLKNAFKDFVSGAISSSMEQIGTNLYNMRHELMTGEEAAEALKKNLAGQTASLLKSIGPQMTMTGLQIAGNGAVSGNVGLIAGGLALAAAGGAASIGGGILDAYANNNGKDKNQEALDRLTALRDNLAALLEQARNDAEYYAENLRSRTAIAVTDNLSTQKVNDMILTPQGTFSTHPDDYIMAMKNPASLMGGGAAKINFQIVNNSSVPLTVERSSSSRNGDNTNIVVVIQDAVKMGIASGEFDGAFSAMRMRQSGSPISS